MDTNTNDIDPRRFGKRLRFLRQQTGWTQSELAERVDVSLNTISAWETGDRLTQPKRTFVARLDKALGAHGSLLESAGYAAGDQLPIDPEFDGTIDEIDAWFRMIRNRMVDYETGEYVPPTTAQLAGIPTDTLVKDIVRFADETARRVDGDDPYASSVRLLRDHAHALIGHIPNGAPA